MAYEDRNKKFEQYRTSVEDRGYELARNWSMAVGLQDADGLKLSKALIER